MADDGLSRFPIALDLLRVDGEMRVNGERVVRGPHVFTNDRGIEYVELYIGGEDPDETLITRLVLLGSARIQLEGAL